MHSEHCENCRYWRKGAQVPNDDATPLCERQSRLSGALRVLTGRAPWAVERREFERPRAHVIHPSRGRGTVEVNPDGALSYHLPH